ncbi:DUF5615 family PIN-like protein [candidate division KSB1 bacterium]|nr:DUF5615 family PIN-like protein [candidate division KSB1 bacterium]
MVERFKRAIKFLADENFNNNILRGVALRNSKIKIIRIQDIGLTGADNQTVLKYALNQNLALLTHNVETIPRFAYERIKIGGMIPGIIIIKQELAIRVVIDTLLLIHECCNEIDLKQKILYLSI